MKRGAAATGARTALWLALVAAIYASIAIAFGTPFVWQDIATFFGSTTQPYQIFFGVQAVDDVPTSVTRPQWAQFRRTREEDGSQDSVTYPRSQWTFAATVPQGNFYGIPVQTLPRAGHYSYETRLCAGMPPEPDQPAGCSPWASSKDPNVGQLDASGHRAWWIYGYLDPAPPSSPVVTAQ